MTHLIRPNSLFGPMMIPRSSVKPLELVISAIHCLKERKGSSPRNILKYLIGKYNVNTKALKNHVQAGLKRGLSFGLITQRSGLYRLNDILSAPTNIPKLKSDKKQKNRLNKKNKQNKKKKLKKRVKKGKARPDKSTACASLKYNRKSKKSRVKKGKKKKKPASYGDKNRQKLIQRKRRKLNRQKIKPPKVHKSKADRIKKPTSEKDFETSPPKVETNEVQRCNVSNKELKN